MPRLVSFLSYRAILLLGVALSCAALAHSRDSNSPIPPGTDIRNFEEVVPSTVFRGSTIDSEGDFTLLRSKNIRSIVSLRGFPLDVHIERKRAISHGLRFFDAPMEALPIKPPEAHVNFALDAIGNPGNQPVYFHCKLGRDRTGMVAALYRVIYQGWSPAEAHAEWEKFGFTDPPLFRGLERYFDEHLDPLLYWQRHPVLTRIPDFSPSESCWNVANARGGKDTFCRIGDTTLPAAELMRNEANRLRR